MEIKVYIWSKRKKLDGKGLCYNIENTETITEEEICEFILDRYKDIHEYSLRDDTEYSAEISEVIHT